MNELTELRRQGLSIQAISGCTGFDRKTVRKYLRKTVAIPEYPARARQPSKLDPFKGYLEQRLQAGVWNAQVLLRELRSQGYSGGYTILTDWLRPQRQAAGAVAVRRFETPPGRQAQVDWGHLGTIRDSKGEQKLSSFVLALGFSRVMFGENVTDQKLGTLLRLHEHAFHEFKGVPKEILYDRMRTICHGTDERGETLWHPVFLDFAQYWGFTPRLCRPYRAQTKGKVEAGVKYLRRNFLCGLQGREPATVEDLNAELRHWLATVANQRIHGTTHESVAARWEVERTALQPLNGRPPFPYVEGEDRKVYRDAYVSWQASRYSVPWPLAGKEVNVSEAGGEVTVRYCGERIAQHCEALAKHSVVTAPEHHADIPLGSRRPTGKTMIHLAVTAPSVEVRPLAAYESLAGGTHDAG